MKPVEIISSILLLFSISVIFSKHVLAQENNQFITIVNPVRISTYTDNSKESIEIQYSVISENGLPATWLLTYDAIVDEGVYSVTRSMDIDQEIGIFLEMTPKLAEVAGVDYNDTGAWHHATSVFLSGYTQEERKLLIDTIFEEFNKRFGFYPTSVGSWWTDSFSLSYMKDKYNITANLGVADQFSTDGYQVWGQYWSTPFYPSKYHAGIPAANADVKLDIVTIQWAPRDPYNGYKSSLYSTQDYFVNSVHQKIDYFEKLIRLYAGRHDNQFGQITVGLEGDLSAGAYGNQYTEQMRLVRSLTDSGDYITTNMEQFSRWYRETYQDLSPSQAIVSDDLLGKPLKTIWYQSPRYRIGLVSNYESGETKILDLRSYHSDLEEPYYQSPNSEFTLSINIPSYLDEVNDIDSSWYFDLGEFKSSYMLNNSLFVKFAKGELELFPEKLVIKNTDIKVPVVISKSPALNVKQADGVVEIVPKESWIVGREGLIINDLTDIATHQLDTKRTIIITISILLILLTLGFLVKYSELSERKKFVLLTLLIVPPLLYFQSWYKNNTMEYFVSQGEIDVLYRLSTLPEGRVVVVDSECLGCSWHTEEKPAVFANKRSYIQNEGKHPIVYNSSVFNAETQKESREEFEKLNARYIYLAKYEKYIEKTPFSPGDLGIEKIYSNANAEIWGVE